MTTDEIRTVLLDAARRGAEVRITRRADGETVYCTPARVTDQRVDVHERGAGSRSRRLQFATPIELDQIAEVELVAIRSVR